MNCQMNNSLYGSYRTRKFTDIYDTVDKFLEDYNDLGIPPSIPQNSDAKKDPVRTLYYLLYARYGNSHIASSDETQFKYKLFSIIFQYGPTWARKLEIQSDLRKLDLNELMDGGKAIYNHSYNPSTLPSTDTMYELETINDQNVTKYKKSKMEAMSLLTTLLEQDVTGYFLDKFKKLFIVIVEPECLLWYVTDLNDEGEEDYDSTESL